MGFDVSKWNKQRYLAEAGEEIQGSVGKAINNAIPEDYDPKDLAKDIAYILKDGYGSQNFKSFMNVLHDELGMEPLNEEVTYDTYNVKVILKDPSEGGPSDEWEDTKIKVDSSLKGEDIESSIMGTLNDMGYNIHSIRYNKA